MLRNIVMAREEEKDILADTFTDLRELFDQDRKVAVPTPPAESR